MSMGPGRGDGEPPRQGLRGTLIRKLSMDLTGTILGEHYKLTQLIDGGGQSLIYRAKDLSGGPDVAVKLLRERFTHDADFRERLAREAMALHDLRSPATLKLRGQYWLPDGQLCLVTEFLHGRTLTSYAEGFERGGQWMPVRTVLDYIAPIVDSLSEAHARGIVHRDLKPDNVFVLDEPAQGTPVKLLDFGFAKFLRLRSFTGTNLLAGSPKYIAPEAWKGHGIDERFDVYSLGAVVYRCLTGQPPFPVDDLKVLLQTVTTAPRPSPRAIRPDLPPAIDDWIEHALAIDPNQRFQNVRALEHALRDSLRRA